MITRRTFIQSIALAAAGTRQSAARPHDKLGPLRADPNGILDLPAGFEYRVILRQGDEMDDGLLVPARADGMAAFERDDGLVALVCNHENHPSMGSAFGPGNERLDRIDRGRLYDPGAGRTPGTGGTTTVVYDVGIHKVVSRHLSLAGTEVNCAGGPTPWGSWLSCEECFENPGKSWEKNMVIERERRHGYVFEVPASATEPVEPEPIRAMGRFEHEAAAIDPVTGAVYMTEDRFESLVYRYIPAVPGELHRGGRLQALAVAEQSSFDTRNWRGESPLEVGRWLATRWIDLDDVDPEANDLRLRGADAGAAIFARGEGLCYADGGLFFTATIGGPELLGQVFEYDLAGDGRLRLLAESSRDGLLKNGDNLTMSPWGDLIVCEDTANHCGLVGITPGGVQYPLADNAYTDSELAGACFSPDGSTLFVNVQDRGLTLAITGPWPDLGMPM